MKRALLLTSFVPLSLFCATQTWNQSIDQKWSTGLNWTPGPAPNAQGDSAIIGSAVLGATSTISQDISPTVTLGSITFQSTTAFGYNISGVGTNSITMSVAAGNANISVPIAPTNTASHIISVPLALSSNLVLNNQNNTQSLTLAGVISGGSSVTVSSTGTGLTILSGANSFTGGTTVTSGTLQCGQANTLPAAGSVTMTGGTLDLNNNAQTIAGISGSAPVTLGTAALTVQTTGASSYGGSMSGTGSLTVSGTGSLTLTAVNAYNGGTTISGGTLIMGLDNALNAAGSMTVTSGTLNLNSFNLQVSQLSGAGNVTLGTDATKALTVQGNNSTTFSGVISGSGQLVKAGTSTLTLSGSNTYTGGTFINGGTLMLGASGALPSAGAVTLTSPGIFNLNNFNQTVGTLTGNAGSQVILGTGQLTVQPTATANFAGVISGAGSVIYQGPSTWTIQTAQTYTGGTTINGGTLRMGVANGLAPAGSMTINSPGILSLNNFNLAVASLAGNGSVNLGSGTLTLQTTGSTTYDGSIAGTGGLTVQGSGVQILTGTNSYSGGTTVGGTATLQGTTASLQGAIVNNSTLFFNQGFNGTFSGPLSGAGLLRIGGGGIVRLTGTPSQGSATVSSGELKIASSSTLTATTVNVNNGARLSGSGTYAANILNAGTIEPSGTLSVAGNVTFQPNSFFLADLTPTTSDHLNVTGTVTIDPSSTVIANVNPGVYQVDNIYTIISAGNPVVGQFQHVVIGNPFLNVNFLYNQVPPGSVQVDLNIRSFSEVIQGGNAGQIATCITQDNMRANADLEALVTQLIFLPVKKVTSVLNEMQPSQLKALTVAEQENSLLAQEALNFRMMEFNKSGCDRDASLKHNLNFWFNLSGSYIDQRNSQHNVGFGMPSGLITTGIDAKISHKLFLGVALDYGFSSLHFRNRQGSSHIQRGSVGPYLSYTGRIGYLNLSTLGSLAHFNTSRHIPFFGVTAKSHHNLKSLLPHIDTGFTLHPAPRVTLTPFAAVDYIMGWENGLTEKGAGVLDFHIDSSKPKMLRYEAGIKISKCAIRSHSKWIHDLKASWVLEDRFHGKDLQATFEEFPCSFTVKGLYPTRNLLNIGMGLAYLFKQDRFAATLRYEGLFSTAVSIQQGTVQFTSRF